MKFLTFKQDGYETLGVASEDGKTVYSLPDIGISYFNMTDLVERLTVEDYQTLTTFLKNPKNGLPYEEIEKCSPIPCPAQDIICLGINYMQHAEEAAKYENKTFGGERPYPIYFSKRVNEAVPDGGMIQSHSDIEARLDYECELAVIIGKETSKVSREEAYDHVFGYTVLNDVSARVLQTRHKQWYFGKSLDGFTPMGPWIVTTDEIPGKPSLKIQSYVNGELRQDSTTDLLIFDVAYVISELSQGMTLLPGTIISMGTPAGVGMGFDPPKFLKSGDTVDCVIEGIGTLHNTVE
ncbi:MAG: fumarylacetoacetate hydrolase family protein [Lachnospiraceae bacterium]|jgi:2-keto-4-pentenoate hydratase/2-oxohepta-3-ene-1,7-dioic acid hydratase in catechol pathway|nr:fumarylacetoacetate hydrolase family protein [Lachnospiraceae bacterium]MCI1727791.1 fumarylacetoacetate hydrolase family protein [Lachnospiraceae bacterium]